MTEFGAWALLLGYLLGEVVDSSEWKEIFSAAALLGFVLLLTGLVITFWKALS